NRASNSLPRPGPRRLVPRISPDACGVPSPSGSNEGVQTLSGALNPPVVLVDVSAHECHRPGFLSHRQPDSGQPPAQCRCELGFIRCLYSVVGMVASQPAASARSEWI